LKDEYRWAKEKTATAKNEEERAIFFLNELEAGGALADHVEKYLRQRPRTDDR
jgi:hypothetical protein